MIDFLKYNFSGKKAIVRVDFNVPVDKTTFEIKDDKRIQSALPTLNHILNEGGAIILLSHFGRPKNGPEDQFSLRHVVQHLSGLLNREVVFCQNFKGAKECASALAPGGVMLLENVRFDSGETKGDEEFAHLLASLGDCFVNDAFGAAHRAHASTTQIASHFPQDRMMGLLMAAELDNAKRIMVSPRPPFTAIVGGAKVSDKVLIIENLLNVATDIVIGGGMAYTFIKAKGGQIGSSLLEEDRLDTVLNIYKKAKDKGVNLHLPEDSIVANAFDASALVQSSTTKDIPANWMGLDIGPKAIEEFRRVILKSNTILWNGPMGVFEWKSFENGTKNIALAVAEATKSGAYSLIGGGDSAAAIAKFNLSSQVSYVSTGGGALLELFEGKTLPGVKALS